MIKYESIISITKRYSKLDDSCDVPTNNNYEVKWLYRYVRDPIGVVLILNDNMKFAMADSVSVKIYRHNGYTDVTVPAML